MSTLVVIPTYNESDNIAGLVSAIYLEAPEVEILVVDDNSPDGTASVVKGLIPSYPKLHLLLREKKEGLGAAYCAGFQWGLERNFQKIIQMDADFSHSPSHLPALIKALDRYDVAVGSRYIKGGAIRGWPWYRHFLSFGGSRYARYCLSLPYNDMTGGFNAWTTKALKQVHLESIRSKGYVFQIEMKYRAHKAGLKIVEVPIVFEERRKGHTKMEERIILEAFVEVYRMRQRSFP